MSEQPKNEQAPAQTPAKDEMPALETIKPALLAEEPGAAIAAPKPASVSEENAPDPDEDDLDDLDDMLDEFSKPAPPAASTTDPAPKTMEETHGLGDMDALSEEDFAKHLQDGMAELLGGMDGNPQLASEFESMMKNLTSGAGMEGLEGLIPQPGAAPALQAPKPSVPSASAPEKTKAPASEESFQDTIKKLQEKIAASGDQATAAAQEEPTDDILAELMKQMGAGSLDGEGGEEDFSKMLLGMMEQLTNKEILYTPMKELDDKYPEWMEKNAKTTPEEDLKRYRDIQRIVKEIVGKFEESTYKDSNVADREYIVERMQLMQSAGSPPADLVGDMASAQEAFGAPDQSCAQQ